MSTSTFPGWISLDSIDAFLSRHSGPWGLSSVHDYEEPALHSYSTVVPDPAPESSAADVLLAILFYACAFVMMCAALMPTYLAFESQILKVLKPLDDFTREMCEALDDALPQPISAYEMPGPSTSKAEDVDDVFFDASQGPTQLPPPSPPVPAASTELDSPLSGTPTIPMSMFFVQNALAHLQTTSKQDREEILRQQRIQFDTIMKEMSKMFKQIPATPTSPPATAADIQGILEDCRDSTMGDCQSAIQEQQKAFKDEMVKLIQDATAAPTPPALTTRDLDALAERIQKQTIESCTTVFQGSLVGTKKDLLHEVKLANQEAHEECNTKAARLPVSESRQMRRLKEENSRLRKDILVVTSERDEASSKARTATEQQCTSSPAPGPRQSRQKPEVATAAQIDHFQDLAARDELARQVAQQHQADLAAKDANAGQIDAKHKQAIKNATAAYQKTKRQLDDTVAEQDTASELWKAEYREACAKAAELKAKEVAKGVEEQQARSALDHAQECQKLRDQHDELYQGHERLVLDHGRLQLYCDRLNELATHQQHPEVPPPSS